MGFLDILRAIINAFCAPSRPQAEPSPGPQAPGKPEYFPPAIPQEQRPHAHEPYHRNDYLGHAQDPHYVSLRKRADEVGADMGRLFGESREAYERGDGAEAKRLSDQAKSLREEKGRLHREAAEWIYRKNNEGRESGEVDLHGLRAEEAIEYTEQAMLDAKHRGISNLRLIVGKGIHSQSKEAVLKPRIEELMQKQNVVAELDPNNSGVLIVHLRPEGIPSDRAIDPEEITRKIENEDKSCVIM